MRSGSCCRCYQMENKQRNQNYLTVALIWRPKFQCYNFPIIKLYLINNKNATYNAYNFTIFGLIITNEPKHNLANQTWQLIFTTVFINIINGRCRLHFSQHDMSAIMTYLLLQKQKLQRHIKPNLIIQINMMIL